MKIRHARLEMLLKPQGFLDSQIGDFALAFFRPDAVHGLFQKIHIDCQGKNGEAIYGSVSASVVRYVHLKIDDRHHLMELDFNKERNWTIVESSDQAKVWEMRFANIAPAAAEVYARQHGGELLRQTACARRQSTMHLQLLNSTQSLYQQIQIFKARHGNHFLQEAERLAGWPGVMQVYDAEEIYTLACLAILSSDSGAIFVGQDPLENHELMWQIQLVADGILSWAKQRQN